MAAVLFLVFTLGFAVLVLRLVKLQMADGASLQQKALAQQTGVFTIRANRGTIYDRNRTALAESATTWDVVVSPAFLKTGAPEDSAAKRAKLAADLASLLGTDSASILAKISRNVSYVVVASRVESDVAALVRAYKAETGADSVSLVEDTKRYYPYNDLAAQLIGFTGSDNQGLSGLEAYYDSVLKGKDGRIVTAKNAAGTDMPIQFSDRIPATPGDSIVLTLDEVVQHALEKELDSAVADNNVTVGATGIVMDVKTGGILAMATVPSFNPNDPFTVASASELQKIDTLTGDAQKAERSLALQTQWRNKAITNPYEPGSTFKIVTAAAALDAGVVKESDRFFDGGSTQVSGTTFHCWKHGGHGSQNFLQGFENSCNVVFIEVGQRLGVAKFYHYFTGFGLSAKTGIDLPGEAQSIFYTAKQMGPVELASISFGQSNKLTPIQLLTAVSAIADGGKLVKPHLLEEELNASGRVVKSYADQKGKQVISAATAKEMCSMMQKEVEEGTGKNAYVAGYRVGGKTGTSQKLDQPGSTSVICSFIGIAPCDDPRYAVLVLLDDPHAPSNFGGTIVAPVVGNLFSEILPYLGVKAEYTPGELEKLEVKTPNTVGQKLSAAEADLQKAGLKVSAQGGGQTVTAQVPEAGGPIPRGGTVILYMGGASVEDSVRVPKLTGLTAAQASAAAEASGLNISLQGNSVTQAGEVSYAQSMAEGAKVPPGTVVTVQFKDDTIGD